MDLKFPPNIKRVANVQKVIDSVLNNTVVNFPVTPGVAQKNDLNDKSTNVKRKRE